MHKNHEKLTLKWRGGSTLTADLTVKRPFFATPPRPDPFWNVLFPYGHCPLGAGGGVESEHLVCALFRSFGQCKKTMRKIGSEKSAPRCPFDRGWGGLKLFGQCLYGNNTIQKEASLSSCLTHAIRMISRTLCKERPLW